jgi:hypothetical protein
LHRCREKIGVADARQGELKVRKRARETGRQTPHGKWGRRWREGVPTYRKRRHQYQCMQFMNPPSGWHASASAHTMLRHSPPRELNVSHPTAEKLAGWMRLPPVKVVAAAIGLPLTVCIILIAFCAVVHDRSNGRGNPNAMIYA